MKNFKSITGLCVALALCLGSTLTASAQLPIKIPKISKPRSQPTPTESARPASNTETQPKQPESRNAAKPSTPAENSAAGEDQPTIAKDSIRVRVFTFGVYRKNYDVWSWVPEIDYRVNGPIASGSQLYVEFNVRLSGSG